MEIKLSDVVIENRYRKEFGDISKLAESIKNLGLLQPIGITENNRLIFGERRLRAFQFLGRETIPARVVNVQSLIQAELDENDCRLDFTISEKVAIGAAIEAELGNRQGLRTDQLVDDHPQVQNSGKKTREIAAEKAGFGSDLTYRQAKEVVAKGDESLIEALDNGIISLNAAKDIASLPKQEQAEVVAKGEKEILAKAKEIRLQQITERKAEQHRKVEEISKGNKAITGGKKYRVIYADPPWQYGDTRTGLDGYSAAADHYPTMSIQQMCELPIKELALDDAVLFMWVTSPLLEECFPLINAWGFKYKASFVWDKVKHNVGHYNSVRHEFLLICTRGSCKPDIPRLIDSVQEVERTEKHSEKPEHFREIIDSLYTVGNKIELFRRGKSPEGWDVWGNQADD